MDFLKEEKGRFPVGLMRWKDLPGWGVLDKVKK